jgi:DNA polymerase III delta prime subunit
VTLVINKPAKPDDFVLITQTRKKLEAVLDGTVKFPGNGVCSLLLHGTYGTGKTTMAMLLPGWLETCKTTNYLDSGLPSQVIDYANPNYNLYPCAQGQNGVAMISNIQNFTGFVSFNQSNLHYVLLDEVDLLTPAASASLKAIMNRPDVVFILTTNHLNQVDKGVINRSILLDMDAPPTNAWVNKIKNIYSASGIAPPSDEAIALIVEAGQGSARSILTDIEITQTLRCELKEKCNE